MAKTWYNLETGVPGVRLATKKDEGEIFGLLSLMHAEMGFFTMNRDKVMAMIQWATERQGGIIHVIDEGPRVVATLGMLITSDWYSDDEYLAERWNFVHPDYRKGDYARKLLEQGKWTHEWFKARGKLMPFCCGINSLIRTEAKIRLFARHMPLVGATFGYGLTPRQQDAIVQEMKAIEELNKQNRRMPMDKQPSRPAVETVIRIAKRQEDSHVL